jgi:hypothetical protein
MTKNNQPYSPLNHKLAAWLSVGFSLLITVLLFTKSVFGEHDTHFHSVDFHDADNSALLYYTVVHFITDVFAYYLLYRFCFWVFRKEWKKRKKHTVSLLVTLGAAMLINAVFSIAVLQLFHSIIPDGLHSHIMEIGVKRGLWATFIVFVSTLSISTFIRNQQTLVENQRLVAENIRNRYEALKHQLDPHFLFNSLNTLDGLIGFDDEKAHQYLQNLSSTFRYTIQNREITTLKNELNFTESYAYLMKIRYGDNLNIRYAVDEKYHSFYIMPVSLQLLLENAVKHNVINDKRPLTIHVETTEKNTIKVSNAIQPKINAEAGEGIGLANLVERYRLLFGMSVVITQTDVFAVEIPLIKNHQSKIFNHV